MTSQGATAIIIIIIIIIIIVIIIEGADDVPRRPGQGVSVTAIPAGVYHLLQTIYCL